MEQVIYYIIISITCSMWGTQVIYYIIKSIICSMWGTQPQTLEWKPPASNKNPQARSLASLAPCQSYPSTTQVITWGHTFPHQGLWRSNKGPCSSPGTDVVWQQGAVQLPTPTQERWRKHFCHPLSHISILSFTPSGPHGTVILTFAMSIKKVNKKENINQYSIWN